MNALPQLPGEDECPRAVLAANADDPRFAAVDDQRVRYTQWTASSALGANLMEPIGVSFDEAPLFLLDLLHELIAAAATVLVKP